MSICVRVWDRLSDTERRALTDKRDFRNAEFRMMRRRVARIIQKVRRHGDRALRHFSGKYNGYQLPREHSAFKRALLVTAEERRLAAGQVPARVRAALDMAMANARAVQTAEQTENQHNKEIRGVSIHHRRQPIPSVGLYVPRGRGSFPSMMVMLGVPAQIAGVPRIAVMTPPHADGTIDPATLYVAETLGITQIYKIGGAHAIAAMALGTESVPAVDKIFGPGSAYVTIARQLLHEVTDCGMPAGPSESMIIADDNADPRVCAVDLMIEAEHGNDSMAFLVTASDRLISEVQRIIATELAHIPSDRRAYISAVLGAYGGIVKSADYRQAITIANALAPEHLKIDTAHPNSIAQQITAAGEILLGPHSAFSIANYLTGANSILPTNRNARTWSALSVDDFCVRRAHIEVHADGFEALAPHTIALAEYERFYAHAHAIRARTTPHTDAESK